MATLRRSIVASLLFTVFGGPTIVLVVVPWLITHFRIPHNAPLGRTVLAVAFIGAGLVPLLESIVRFVMVGRGALVPGVPTENLVVSGWYRFVRNPMYCGVLLAIAGETLLFWNRDMILYWVGIWLVSHIFVCFYEEPKLTRTFGQQYLRYCQQVPRWTPRFALLGHRNRGI